MKMKSLKRTKEDTDENAKLAPMPHGGDSYPYGTRINLDHETLEKLGVGELPKVGKKIRLEGRGRVVSASEHSNTDGSGKAKKRRSLEIQLEHMGLGAHEPKSAEEAVDDGIDEAG